MDRLLKKRGKSVRRGSVAFAAAAAILLLSAALFSGYLPVLFTDGEAAGTCETYGAQSREMDVGTSPTGNGAIGTGVRFSKSELINAASLALPYDDSGSGGYFEGEADDRIETDEADETDPDPLDPETAEAEDKGPIGGFLARAVAAVLDGAKYELRRAVNVGTDPAENCPDQGVLSEDPEPAYNTFEADGSVFGVMRASDGALLCDAVGFASFAGATEVTRDDDGTVRASGGGYDVTVGANDEYVLSSGRAFWTGRAPLVADGGVYVPVASLASAFGYTVTTDEDGAVYMCGTGIVESAEDHYDATDLFWLSHIIYAESGCEPMLGKIAVGNVVLNRVRGEAYPDSVYGVIFDRRFGVQFSPTESGTIYLEPSEEAVIAAKICLEGYSVSDEIEFFFNPEIAQSTWISDNRTWVMTIAHHAFYS